MSEQTNQPTDEKVMTVRSAIDFSIVGENILDIANFAIEKYEFKNDTTLSAEAREAAIAKIKDKLWEQVEAVKLRRLDLLKQMFSIADDTLADAIGE